MRIDLGNSNIPKWARIQHKKHVRTKAMIKRGEYPQAHGHSFYIKTVVSVSFECECGKVLKKPRKKSKRLN